MHVLIEPSDYILRNAGDTAMLRVALTRLSAFWPEGTIRVFSDVPEQFPSWAPNVASLSSEGRRAWLHDPFLTGHLPRWTPHSARSAVGRLEEYVRRHLPCLARPLIQNRRHLGGDVGEFVEAVRTADLVLANGMGGVTDAFPEYTSDLLEVMRLAQDAGAVTAMMGQGFGPLRDPTLRALAADVLPRVDAISLREQRAGLPLLLSLGVAPERIVTTGDDAIELAHAARPPHLNNSLGINLRASDYSGVNAAAVDRLRPVLRHIQETLCAPLIPLPISHVPGEEDAATINRLIGWEEGVAVEQTPDEGAPSEEVLLFSVLEGVGRCRTAIVGSYHAAVFALSMGIPVVGLYHSEYYRDKFLGLADQFQGGCWPLPLDAQDFESRLFETTLAAWQSADQLRPHLLKAAAEQVEQGQAAYRRLRDLVGTRRTKVRSRARFLPIDRLIKPLAPRVASTKF